MLRRRARRGDFSAIGDYGFAQPVPRLSRDSSLIAAARRRAHRRARRSDRGRALRRRGSRVLARRRHLLLRAVRVRRGARSPCWRSAGRRPTSRSTARTSALLTAVAGQVATAIENGRLYRQLHLKAEELGRMREFNENILESLDDGLVVFDADERIVRWNRALEGFYGVARAAAIGRHARATCSTRRSSRRCAPRGARHPLRRDAVRVPLTRAAGDATAPMPRAARQRDRGAAAEPCGRRVDVVGMHPAHRGHHRSRAARRAAADFREDGVDRPARRRRRARSQHAADRHLELHADAARGRRSRRSADGRCSRRSSGRRSAPRRSSTAC